jgi:hypothetical protein
VSVGESHIRLRTWARVHSPVIAVLGTGIHELGLFHPIDPPEFRCPATVHSEKVVDARVEHEHDAVWWRLRRFRVARQGGRWQNRPAEPPPGMVSLVAVVVALTAS